MVTEGSRGRAARSSRFRSGLQVVLVEDPIGIATSGCRRSYKVVPDTRNQTNKHERSERVLRVGAQPQLGSVVRPRARVAVGTAR